MDMNTFDKKKPYQTEISTRWVQTVNSARKHNQNNLLSYLRATVPRTVQLENKVQLWLHLQRANLQRYEYKTSDVLFIHTQTVG